MGNQIFLTFLIALSYSSIPSILSYPQGLPTVASKAPVSVVKDERIHEANGTFSYDIVLTDGTKFKQSGGPEGGSLKEGDDPYLIIKGEYTFVDPLGKSHTVMYVADKNGFQPEGDGIPKVNVPSLKKAPENKTKLPEPPLKTISSSIFSSPSATF